MGTSANENTTLLKHEKNKNILALSSVCKPWYMHITGCVALFQDIAFDVSSGESIATAHVFLKRLEGTEVSTYVYANIGHYLDPALAELFAKLRPRIEHIVHFEYHGDMDRYRPYLDSPAPNLLFFSDNFDTLPGRGPPIFCGHAPKLRALTTLSPGPGPMWITSTLSDLAILNLSFLDMGFRVSLGSFLELLRGSPRLESIHVGSFVPSIDPNEDLQDVSLPHLHTLDLQHNEFHTLTKHLRVPNVRQILFCGESHPVCGVAINPTFEAPHFFDGLPSFPIFERPIERVYVGTREGTEFSLRLTAEGGFVLRAWLAWVADAVPLFDGYVKRSITELMGMITLAPQAHVQLHHPYLVPSGFPIYQPFLLVADIGQLTIRGGFAADVLDRLTVRSDYTPLLPCLRLLNIMDRSPLTEKEIRESLLFCLQSRKDFRFAIRLVDEELPCTAYRDLGFAVKRRFHTHSHCFVSDPIPTYRRYGRSSFCGDHF